MNEVWVYGKEDLFKIIEVLTNAEYVVKIVREKEYDVQKSQAYLVTWIHDEAFGGQTFEVIDWEDNAIVGIDGSKAKFKFIEGEK
jgi:hypothetical protein